MDKIKKTIILLIILILVIVLSIVLLKLYKENEFAKNDGIGLTEEEDSVQKAKEYKKLVQVKNRNTYASLERVINKYVNAMKNYNIDIIYTKLDGEVKVSKEQKMQYLTQIKNMSNIQDDTINEQLKVFTKCEYFWISKMYSYKLDDNKILYPIEGCIVNEDKTLEKILLIVEVDLKDDVFAIIQNEIVNDIGEVVSQIDFEKINKNSDNAMSYISISDEDWVQKYFYDFKQKITTNPEYFYNNLDEEYRHKRFENVDDFKEYVKNNYLKIYVAKNEKYKMTQYEEYTEYIYIDQNNNYYIFQEYAPFDYKVFLDTYTILTNDSKEKYDNAKERQKAEMNLGKFIEALNTKDYKYIYNHLDEGYRDNNFKTIDDFKKSIEENFYDKNTIELLEYDKQGDIYVYSLRLKNTKNEIESKQLKVAIKLLENREFVMSFNI